MRYECPEYVLHFKCSADRCSDNCCIGWEIGIDPQTSEKYKKMSGTLGDKIRKNLDTGGTYCTFRLGDGRRCPMLDENNLCEIIKERGEDNICEICREHPRFYNVLEDKVEWGIGLSCEEAARLILECEQNAPVFSEREDTESVLCDGELLAFLLFARDRIYELLESTSFGFNDRIKAILTYAEAVNDAVFDGNCKCFPPERPIKSAKKLSTGADFEANNACADMISALDSLEFLDAEFKERLRRVAHDVRTTPLPHPDKSSEARLTRLFKYFIHRYFITAVFDSDPLSKVKLAVILTLTVHALTKNSESADEWVMAAKALSKEAEYNEENLELIFEMTYTEQSLSDDNLFKILT